MSIVSVVITKQCTVHASDSFITKRVGRQKYEVLEKQQSKITRVPRWRGALSYWGLAGYNGGDFSTLHWLQQRAHDAVKVPTAEEFAGALAADLSKIIGKVNFADPTDAGIGIHFTAYELISNVWIPELFLISNWQDTNYAGVHSDGFRVSRETFHVAFDADSLPAHRDPEYRLQVHKFLHQGKILRFNNGDPILFNLAAKGLLSMFQELAARETLENPDRIDTYRAIARRPIEVVASAQRDFCRVGTRIVGGKPHDLAITPGGEYTSTTGDE
ncbi:MAG: hypothetical protein ACE145_02850 [Terriglobia bacterium]